MSADARADAGFPDATPGDQGFPDTGVHPDATPGDTGEHADATAPGAGEISGVKAVGEMLPSPLDAVPSPDGTKVYFTAFSSSRIGSVYSVGQDGMGQTELATGLAAPESIVVSRDDTKLFVADTMVEVPTDALGVIYSLSTGGGALSEMASTRGYRPRSLDLAEPADAEVLYFTGTDPADGADGIFKIPAAGGSVTIVAKGSPLWAPSGVAVASNGTVYVAVTDGMPGIYRVSGATVEPFVVPMNLGYPAGIALTQSQSHLLVSGLTAAKTAVVYRVRLDDKQIEPIDSGISQNTESGGVHRAHGVDRYAWADCDDVRPGGRGGTVYLLGTQASPL
ncbi:MAG: hypothetical protein HY791_25740 [Deltaproteobacteria bacterium]|nr:hypothetical protein [Deltaproteobacteria bacterium]